MTLAPVFPKTGGLGLYDHKPTRSMANSLDFSFSGLYTNLPTVQ
jgi:hypothetical protein